MRLTIFTNEAKALWLASPNASEAQVDLTEEQMKLVEPLVEIAKQGMTEEQKVLQTMTEEVERQQERNQQLEQEINTLSEALRVMLNVDLTDEQRELINSQYEKWEAGKDYPVNKILSYNNGLFRVIQGHTSQEDWLPDSTPALYTVFIPPRAVIDGEEVEIIPDFVQPTGAHDTFNMGDKVRFNGKVYESLIDNNAYSPEAYPQGWKLVE